MRLRTAWLLACAVALLACGDDDDVVAANKQQQRHAAEALARAMHFDGGELVDGSVALATEHQVSALVPSAQNVKPEQNGLLQFREDDPIDDNPTGAVLLQFGDVDQHVRVPKEPDDDGNLALAFQVDDDLCDMLCNTRIEVEYIVALELDDGAISEHKRGKLVVDCRQDGDPEYCAADAPGPQGSERDGGPQPGAGNAGSSGSMRDGSVPISSGATAVVNDLFDNVEDFNTEVCACLPAGTPMSLCSNETAPERACREEAVADHAEAELELLACAATVFEDQIACVRDAGCDPDMLSACVMAEDSEPWAAIEAACGSVPQSLQDDFAACDPPYVCDDGSEVPGGYACNGVPDCEDGSDEANCMVPPNARDFPCADGSGVEPARVCDGTDDCPSGLDEMVCVQCPDGSGMYSPFNMCDGEPRCTDGSDEAGCSFTCVDGGMVLITSLCNGTPDCADGSDESFCMGAEFTCPDGEMIPFMQVCDGNDDCSDGGDEADTFCGGM